jgi:hypothetical protein
MERPLQILIAFLLAEKLVDGKSDHGNTWNAISRNTPLDLLQNAWPRLFSSELA